MDAVGRLDLLQFAFNMIKTALSSLSSVLSSQSASAKLSHLAPRLEHLSRHLRGGGGGTECQVLRGSLRTFEGRVAGWLLRLGLRINDDDHALVNESLDLLLDLGVLGIRLGLCGA